MKDEKLFDYLENADDSEIEIIMKNTPELSKGKLNRIIAMSEKKYEMKKNQKSEENNMNSMTFAAEVTGVENYNRPFIVKILGFAAGIAVVAGIVTIGSLLLKNGGGRIPEQPPQPLVTAITSTTETVTETTSTVSAVNSTDTTAANIETFTTESGIYTTVSGANTSESASSQTAATAENNGYMVEGRDNDADTLRYIEVAKNMTDDYMHYTNLKCNLDLNDSFSIYVQAYDYDANEIAYGGNYTFYRVTDDRCNSLSEFRKYLREFSPNGSFNKELYEMQTEYEDQITPGCTLTIPVGCPQIQACEYNGNLYFEAGEADSLAASLDFMQIMSFVRSDNEAVIIKKRPDLVGDNGASEAFEAYVVIDYPHPDASRELYSLSANGDTTQALKFIFENCDGEWRSPQYCEFMKYSDYEALSK